MDTVLRFKPDIGSHSDLIEKVAEFAGVAYDFLTANPGALNDVPVLGAGAGGKVDPS